MHNRHPRRLLLLLTVLGAAGCLDGPMFALKRINPYYRRQWAKDSVLGPTYHDRISEVRLLRQQLPGMSSEEQASWVESLDTIIHHDPSPEMRREAVLAVAAVKGPRAVELISAASEDESVKVRMAACEAVGQQDLESAIPLLQKMLKDEDVHGVRVAAINTLGTIGDQRAIDLLGGVLQERSPALQEAATKALASSTGKSFGGDVAKWKRYLAGEPVSEEPPSIASRAAEWFMVK